MGLISWTIKIVRLGLALMGHKILGLVSWATKFNLQKFVDTLDSLPETVQLSQAVCDHRGNQAVGYQHTVQEFSSLDWLKSVIRLVQILKDPLTLADREAMSWNTYKYNVLEEICCIWITQKDNYSLGFWARSQKFNS